MPQEKRKSRRYISFLTCDKPESVVECTTIIKSNSPQKKKPQSHKVIVEVDKKKQQNKTSIRGFTRELDTFQLQKVSKGNHVTNSCSSNVRDEDIAKDFLKGVLDLRESLAILSKLRETSKRQHMGFDRPRVSLDGSTRKSFDGVKDVVRESLLRRNVTKSEGFSDGWRKSKGSNLVVKLMGLESLPSSPRYSGLGKQRDFDEILESLNFKGILRSNSEKGLASNSQYFEDYYPLFDEGSPPIVVLRPLRSYVNSFAGNEEDLLRTKSSRGSCDRESISGTEKSKQEDRYFYSKKQISGREKMSISDYRIVKTSDSSRQHKKNRQSISMNQRRKRRTGSESGYRFEIDSNSEDEYAFPTFDSMIFNNLNSQRWSPHSRLLMIPDYDAESHSYFSETRESIDREYFNNDSNDSAHVSLVSVPENDTQSLHSEITSASLSSDPPEVTSGSTPETGITVPLNINTDGYANLSVEEFTPREKLKAFLSSNPSFLNRAEELFNLEINPSLIPNINDKHFSNPQVLVDYAIELMEVRSYQHSQVSLPRFFTKSAGNYPSLSEILEDLCKGYINRDSEDVSSEHLCTLLDRDLRFENGAWGVGWKIGFSMDEVEQIVGEVDKFVLGNLIQEIIVDFLL